MENKKYDGDFVQCWAKVVTISCHKCDLENIKCVDCDHVFEDDQEVWCSEKLHICAECMEELNEDYDDFKQEDD